MLIPERNDEMPRSTETNASRTDPGADSTRAGRLLPASRRDRKMESEAGMTTIEGDARAELSGEHVAEIRKRIRDGAYNTVEVADQVAQRLLHSRDLDSSDD
jgi:anti-sigma28 factor (negative regulator of flagellin synthesis)